MYYEIQTLCLLAAIKQPPVGWFHSDRQILLENITSLVQSVSNSKSNRSIW